MLCYLLTKSRAICSRETHCGRPASSRSRALTISRCRAIVIPACLQPGVSIRSKTESENRRTLESRWPLPSLKKREEDLRAARAKPLRGFSSWIFKEIVRGRGQLSGVRYYGYHEIRKPRKPLALTVPRPWDVTLAVDGDHEFYPRRLNRGAF
jgi:hypothetical protein